MEPNFVLTDIKPTSQAHCWQLLLEGFRLYKHDTFYYIKDNCLTRSNALVVYETFRQFKLYQVYREQTWTDLLEDGPILCSAIYDESGVRIPVHIEQITGDMHYDDGFIYQSPDGSRYKDAIPITLDELKPYLLEYRTGLLK